MVCILLAWSMVQDIYSMMKRKRKTIVIWIKEEMIGIQKHSL